MATDPLSLVFSALADPTRRAILARLAEGEATVGELARPFDMSQPSFAQHLKVLGRAGLITRTRRGTAVLSRLEGEALRPAVGWLADYREHWAAAHDRLDALLAEPQPEEGEDP